MARTAAANHSTAFDQLQGQIEAIRREAYAAGYAAAMQAIRDYASRPASDGGDTGATAPPRRGRPPRAAAAAPAPAQPSSTRQSAAGRPAGSGRAARAAASRPQRGTNARLVEEVLQAAAPRAVRPTEIRDALKRDKGVSMAFTSIRHALGQLEARNAVEQVADTKTWRLTEGGTSG